MSDQIIKDAKDRIIVLEKQLRSNPNDYTAMFKIASYLKVLGENRKASDYFMKLALAGAEQIEVYETGSKALLDCGRYTDLLRFINLGLKIFPENAVLYLRKGHALHKMEDYKGAEDAFLELQKRQPDAIDSAVGLGTFYVNSGQLEKGLSILEDSLKNYPDNIAILNNIGAAYLNAKEYVKASEYFIKALRIDPDNTQCMLNIGSCFEKMKKPELAMQFYEEAITRAPEEGPVICAKASLMCNQGLAQEAIPMYEKGLEILSSDPRKSIEYLINFSNYIFYLHYSPESSRKKIRSAIDNWQKKILVEVKEKDRFSFNNAPEKSKKLRIGMISGSFNVHPVGQMIYSAISNLDKDLYEVFMYSDVQPVGKDYLYDLFKETVTCTRDIFGEVSARVLDIIRNDEIDVMLEMTGHSDGGKRLPLIAHRVAPVQVKWVGGLFNTTGIPQMDWLLSDNIETPEGEEKWYAEKLYRMPDDYVVYYPPYYAPKVSESPAIKNGFITFGNLNNLAKTNSYSIGLWSKILHMVPNSKLLLKGNKMDTPFVVEHLRKSFEAHGIGVDRLLIEGGEPHQKFLGVYNRIDIALDPHPYTGGLTTCEALWMGVPVVTLPGETFAGRHAATHLTNAGMPEWIAKDEQDYINIAVKWASDVDALSELRAGLRDHVAKTPLVDGPRFAKNFEIALRHMWNEWCDQKLAADKPAKVTKPKPTKSKKRK